MRRRMLSKLVQGIDPQGLRGRAAWPAKDARRAVQRRRDELHQELAMATLDTRVDLLLRPFNDVAGLPGEPIQIVDHVLSS